MKKPTRYITYFSLLLLLLIYSPRILLFFPTSRGSSLTIPGYRRDSPILRIDWSPAGDEIALLNENEYYIWNYKKWHSNDQFVNRDDRQPSNFFYLPNSPLNITDAAWSKTTNYLATSFLSFGTYREPLEIRPTTDFAKNREFFSSRNMLENFVSIDWLYNVDILLAASDNGKLYIWDSSAPSELTNIFNSSISIDKLRISQNNSFLALSGSTNQSSVLQIYNLEDFSLDFSYNISNPINSWEWQEDNLGTSLFFSLVSGNSLYKFDFDKNTISPLISYEQPILHFDIANDNETIGIMVDTRIEFSTISKLPEIEKGIWEVPDLEGFAFDPSSTMFVYNSGRNLIITSIADFETLFQLPGYYYEIQYYGYLDLSEMVIILIIIYSSLIMGLELTIKYRNEQKVIADLEKVEVRNELYPE